MDLVKKLTPALLKSKKGQAIIGNILIMILNDKLALGIDPETIKWMTVTVIGYVCGQGVADIGKEKAKVEADVRAAVADALD